MAPPKKPSRRARSEVQRERDLVEIARRLLRRESHQSIADALGLSRTLVTNEVKLLKERWRDRQSEDMHEFIAEEMALTYQVEAEAWKGWDASTTEAFTETEVIKDSAIDMTSSAL